MVKNNEKLWEALESAMDVVLMGVDRVDGAARIKVKGTEVVASYSIYRMSSFIRIDVKEIPL